MTAATTVVSVSGCLLSALIHEDEARSGLLLGDKSIVTACGDDDLESSEEYFNISSYSCGKFYDDAGNILDSLPREKNVVGWWVSRRAPPVPSLRDAAVQASLGNKAPLLLSIGAQDESDVRFSFSKRLDKSDVTIKTRVLKHDTKAELREFHPVAEWSAFSRQRRERSSVADIVSTAFAQDRKVLQDLLDQLQVVEAEADNLEESERRILLSSSQSTPSLDSLSEDCNDGGSLL